MLDRATIGRLGRPALPLAAVALTIVVAAVAFRAWDRSVEDRLARWAVDEVSRRTDGAYRLTLGDLSFLPFAGSISFDSAVVTTDTARNRRRSEPLPVLRWRAQGCGLSGLDVLRLALRRSFAARELECDRVVAAVALVTPEGKKRAPGDSAKDSAATVKELERPLGLSSLRIADVSLPALSLTVERPGPRGGSSLVLQRARFEARALELEQGSLSADRARLAATGLILRPDTLAEFAIAGLEADFTGSTLRLAGAKYEPPIPEKEWVRRVRVRRDRIRFEADSVRARGVAYRAFLATGDIGIRALELSGVRLDVLSDKRIPPGRPSRRRTPQQVAAGTASALRLDSLVVTGGAIVYREREPKQAQAGRVSFDSVRATVFDLHLPSRGEPLGIAAAARLMDAGLLEVEATVPLDAPDFRFRLSGRLGTMPAPAFNRFLSRNESFEFESGVVERITFEQSSSGGRLATAVTPRYRNLSVETTGDGGGVVGSVKREVEEFIADAFVVRSRNPDEDGKKLRTGRTLRRYDPTTTWLQFVWFGLRDAMMEALKE